MLVRDMLSILLTLTFLFTNLFINATHWLDRKAEGWAWYEDKKIVEPEEKGEALATPKTAKEHLKKIKEELEEKLAISVINPTQENVKAYMELQQKWINQSAHFSQAWTQVLLGNPNLDSTIENPVSQYGIQIKKRMEQEKRKKLIESIAKKTGLFFFYEGGNPMSQAMSQVVSRFEKEYNWSTISISVDTIILPDRPQSRLDNGIATKMGVTLYPSLYLVSPVDATITPIAYGFLPMDQVENNIENQHKKGTFNVK